MSTVGGYGAAGHKNRYSYRVRLDNWVEDAAGLRLAATKTEGTVDYTSQTRESFIDPKDMPPAPIPPCKIADITEIIDKNRTGLSYDMIFLHGKKEDYDPHNTYVTVSDIGFQTKRDKKLHHLIQAKDLSMPLKMELTQKMGTQHAHDIRAMTSFNTTTGEMGKYTTEADSRPRKPTEPLPSFGRSAAFTTTHQVYVTGDC